MLFMTIGLKRFTLNSSTQLEVPPNDTIAVPFVFNDHEDLSSICSKGKAKSGEDIYSERDVITNLKACRNI